MERTYARDVKPGRSVLVKGWIVRVRDLGKLKFFLLRDKTGIVQVTLKRGDVPESLLNTVSGMLRESCVAVEGQAKSSKLAHLGLEIIPKKIELISKADAPLPLEIGGESGKDKRFDFRFLDMRDPKVQTIFHLRGAVFELMRQFFLKEGFIETHTPVIQAAGAEGGASMFPVIYYNTQVFLRQSPQLYKQMLMASGLDRVYEIGPAFRAEAFHTRKHVCEFQSVDMEMAWIESEEDVMKVVEGLVHHVYKKLKKNHSELLKSLKIKLTVPKSPFKRLAYNEVVKMISKKTGMKWGDDMGDLEERVLGEMLAKKGTEWYFITKFPSQIKPFYIMADGKYSRGFDLGCKGIEIASGGQREHRLDVLKKVMRAKGLNPEKFAFYLDAFRYGMPPHGGAGLGGDRIIEQITGVPDIKEVIMFPRTPERLIP